MPDDFPVREALPRTRPEQGFSRRSPRGLDVGLSTPARVAFVSALPCVLTAGVAWLAVAAMTVIGTPTYPAGLMLVLLVQAVGFGLCWVAELAALQRAWGLSLITCAGLLPLLALHTTLAGAPYVSLESGSGWPVVLSGVGIVLALIVMGGVAAVAARDRPEDAALAFLPAALLVPALIGVRAELTEPRALAVVGEVFAVAAIAVLLAEMLDPGPRLLAAPVAFCAQIVLLWLSGRGPSFQATSGGVIPFLYATILVATVVLTVAVPVMAFWVRRVARAMVEQGER